MNSNKNPATISTFKNPTEPRLKQKTSGARLFDNPTGIKRIDYTWDWDLNNAILHLKGSGESYKEPEERYWIFSNSTYSVMAVTAREPLMAGIIYWNVFPFVSVKDFKPRALTEREFLALGLPSELSPHFNLTSDEVESYLTTVKNYEVKRK
jgi:hypothetical protein